MSSSIKTGRLCATTLGLLACAAAGAQEAPATEGPQAQTTEQAVLTPEAPASAAGDDIGEVIVTARRVQERLQDVPISITVFNQDQLTDRNITSGSDLANYTPSLTANTRFGTENTSFAIRGFSQEQRTTASVGVYFADVVAPRGGGPVTGGDGAGPGSFFDLANVQVLKGPQGTLFGRNTTGGAVLLVPQKPTGTYEGFVENTLGNYDLLHTTAVVNVPLSDSVRARLGVERNHRDGYLTNTSGIGPKDFADIGYTAYRLSVVADLAPNLENYTIGSYSLSETNGVIPKIIAVNPATLANSRSPVSSLAQMALGQLNAEAGKGDFAVGNGDPNAYTRNERWQIINTTTWTASDALTVKNIASYAQLVNDLQEDLYGSAFVTPDSFGTDKANRPQDAGVSVYAIGSAPAAGLHSVDQYTLSEELQFQGSVDDGRLVWQAGGYFESSDANNPNGSESQSFVHCDNTATLDCNDIVGYHYAVNNGLPAGAVNVGNLGYQVGEISYQNLGIYAQSTYALTDQLKLTGGVRYTADEMKGEAIVGRYVFTGSGADQPAFYCSNPDSGQATGPRVGPAATSLDECSVSYKKKSNAPTWVIDLDYKPIDDLLLYGKYARGYRQGGVTPYSASGATVYDPEKVNSYEIGSKFSFRGAVRGTFNVAAFYNDFQNQQLSIGFADLVNQSVPGNVGIVNAGKSAISGVEVETVLLPVRGVKLDLSYAYLETKIKSIEFVEAAPPYTAAIPSAAEGDPLPYTPKNKLAAGLTYTLPVAASLGEISIGGTYTYQSNFLVTKSSPYGVVDGYGLANLNLNWAHIGNAPVDAGLFVTNVFDKYYYNTVTGGYNNFGWESAYLGEPRMYGARVRVSFGG
ncbi:MAG: TonB-dependent receptor [Hydrocarboniphaga sp.]|uniref:TonB-dependent receptor n=1 Tax=Hydrocarboniphaga sp. TaxID=2033016 RepID=UPI002616FAE9|nr:TonB-dependent receptor [Hydrocarboniphaga sp.]MDB5968624.1 TonB-dependent receptor [Hydrocarboniphaga sp.]